MGSTSALLHESMRQIQMEGRGAVVYLRPEGAGDGLEQRLHRIRRGDTDADTPDLTNPQGVASGAMPMSEREFGIGSQILRNLGVSKLELMTNHKTSWPGLEAFGLEIVGRRAIKIQD